jgi:hypothetical protein
VPLTPSIPLVADATATPGPLAGLALAAPPSIIWWVGLGLALVHGPGPVLAWVLGLGVVAMALTLAVEIAVLRWLGLWSPQDGAAGR